MGWIIALGVLILLALLPIGISIAYHEEGFFLSLVLGPVKLRLLPVRSKKEKDKKKEKKPKEKKTAEKTSGQEEKKGGSILDFWPLVKTAFSFLGGFFRTLWIKKLDVDLVLAGGDPCDLAVNYGRTWIAVGNVMPLLDRLLTIKKRRVNVGCDFTEDQTRIRVYAEARILFGPLLVLLVRYALKLIFQYIGINNQRKGGVTHEPESP